MIRNIPYIIGASTWTYCSHNLRDTLKLISSAGIRHVELWADQIHFDPRTSNYSLAIIKETLIDNHLHVHSVHLPYSQVDQTSTPDDRYEQWETLIETTLNNASYLGARTAILHPYPGDPRTNREAVEVSNRLIATLLERLLPLARRFEIKIAIENMPYLGTQKFGCTMKELKKLIDRFGEDCFGLCLDTSHCVANAINVCEEIRVSSSRLLSIHVSDNKIQGQDMHLVPGEGTINWQDFIHCLESIDYVGAMILEVAGKEDPDHRLKVAYEKILSLMP